MILIVKAARPDDHAVAFGGASEKNAKKVVIWDPLVGPVVYDEERLHTVWKGKSIVCQRPSWAKVSLPPVPAGRKPASEKSRPTTPKPASRSSSQ